MISIYKFPYSFKKSTTFSHNGNESMSERIRMIPKLLYHITELDTLLRDTETPGHYNMIVVFILHTVQSM